MDMCTFVLVPLLMVIIKKIINIAIIGNINTQAAKNTTTPTKPNSLAQANWSIAPVKPYIRTAKAKSNAIIAPPSNSIIPSPSKNYILHFLFIQMNLEF